MRFPPYLKRNDINQYKSINQKFMKNPELYHRSVDILADAFRLNALDNKSCAKCAIGHLVAANSGYTVNDEWYWGDVAEGFKRPEWEYMVWTERDGDNCWTITDESIRQCESTGYSVEELGVIENGFADGDILAVIDVLDQIHEVTDQNVSVQSKSKFKKELIIG